MTSNTNVNYPMFKGKDKLGATFEPQKGALQQHQASSTPL